MKQVLLFLALTVALVAAQTTGNNELLQAINTAMAKWQSGTAASSSWQKWYQTTYPPTGTCSGFDYPATPTAGGTLDAVIKRGTLKIGSDLPSPPLYYTDSSNNLVGFDVDFANFLASELSTKYNKAITTTRVNTAFGDLLTQLNNQAFDVASGGMQNNAARRAIVSFTCNISTGGLGGAVLPGNNVTYNTVNDVMKSGVKVGLLRGTIQATQAADAGAIVVYVDTMDAAYPLLQNETINVWLGAQATISYWATQNADKPIYQLPTWGTINGVAWAVRNDTQTASSSTTATSSAASTAMAASVLVGSVLLALWF